MTEILDTFTAAQILATLVFAVIVATLAGGAVATAFWRGRIHKLTEDMKHEHSNTR